jgi:hypothetical protein
MIRSAISMPQRLYVQVGPSGRVDRKQKPGRKKKEVLTSADRQLLKKVSCVFIKKNWIINTAKHLCIALRA